MEMLIAMVLGGGIVSFAVIVLLMAWTIKVRHKRAPSRVRTIRDEIFESRQDFSSRFSLTPPGIIPLPPPPRHDSLSFSRTTGQQLADKMNRIGGDDVFEKTDETNAKEVWLEESLARKVPAKSNAGADGRGRDERYRIRRQKALHRMSYQEYRAQTPPQEASYEELFQFQNHRLCSHQTQMQHLNQAVVRTRCQMADSGCNGGGINLWGQAWRVPDASHQLQTEQCNGSYMPYNKALSQLRRHGIRKARAKRRSSEGSVHRPGKKARLTRGT